MLRDVTLASAAVAFLAFSCSVAQVEPPVVVIHAH
jgi:hypothetical protein